MSDEIQPVRPDSGATESPASIPTPANASPAVVDLGAVTNTLPASDPIGIETRKAEKPGKGISGRIVNAVRRVAGRKPGPHKHDCGCIVCKGAKPRQSLLGAPAPVAEIPAAQIPDSVPQQLDVVSARDISEFEGWGEGACAIWKGFFAIEISKTRKAGLVNNPADFVERVMDKVKVPDHADGPVKDLGAHLARDFGLPPAGGVYIKAIPAMAVVLLTFSQQMREVRAEFAKGGRA